MIIVDMTLYSAMTHKKSQLVKIIIVNTGTGTEARGNYTFEIRGKKNQLLKGGEIKNWPRKSKTCSALLQKVLNTAYPNAACS